MKECNKCNITKSLTEFCLDKYSKDGRAYTCKICRSEYRKAYNKKVKEQTSEYNRKYRLANLDKIKTYKEGREVEQRAACRKWSKNNPHTVNEIAARKRARRKEQTPVWADIKAIREFYKHCPKGYHVDHIIPLKGVNVSGFHVLENLQYLPALANIKKGNKYGR